MADMTRRDIQTHAEEMAEAKNNALRKIKKAKLLRPNAPDVELEGNELDKEWTKIKRAYGGLSNIPFSELGAFLDKWTELIAYTRWVEAVADLDQASAREIRDTVKKQLYVLQDGGREIRDAKTHIEPLYIEWEKKYNESLVTMIAIKGLREGYEQRANALSREITRRTNDVVDQRRQMNRGQQA